MERTSLLNALKLCCRLKDLEEGKRLHGVAVENGHASNMYVASTLAAMYARCGSIIQARQVFDQMQLHDVVSYNVLILGYAENGQGEDALDLFDGMTKAGCTPNTVTFIAALKACTRLCGYEEASPVSSGRLVKLKSLEKGLRVHKLAADRGCEWDIKVANTLIRMYANCRSMENACKVFNGMRRPDVISRTSLLLGHADEGEGDKALDMFHEMIRNGCKPDPVAFVAALKACTCLCETETAKPIDGKLVKTKSFMSGADVHQRAVAGRCETEIYVASTLIDMYAKCGSMSDARKVFDGMHRHNVVSWTALILGYAENGEAIEALNLFHQMTCPPDSLTVVAALKACGMIGALELGRSIHASLQRHSLEHNKFVATSLIDFYGKCWSMEEAKQVFERLRSPSSIEWTALLAGYSREGDVDQVLCLFEQMQKQHIQPNAITFVCVLSACSQAGLINVGKQVFDAMSSMIHVGVEHYTCMVDMLGRANRLDEAVKLLQEMPVPPNAVTWRALLAACCKWRNVELGQLAFQSLMELNDKDPAAYVFMANICSYGMLEEQSALETTRKIKRRTPHLCKR